MRRVTFSLAEVTVNRLLLPSLERHPTAALMHEMASYFVVRIVVFAYKKHLLYLKQFKKQEQRKVTSTMVVANRKDTTFSIPHSTFGKNWRLEQERKEATNNFATIAT
jgi:hypothetical protein